MSRLLRINRWPAPVSFGPQMPGEVKNESDVREDGKLAVQRRCQVPGGNLNPKRKSPRKPFGFQGLVWVREQDLNL